ncbi:MAG TPA: phosphatase PAP2 family protein [Puia sp.]|nr:phosphatase PAP2 family protein [Puia sp.]
MSLFEWLDHIDKFFLTLIQHDSDNAVLDVVMPVLRDPYTWVPFYVFMLYYCLRKGQQHAWIFISLSLLTFAITDSLTAQIMKPFFERLRPCHDPDMAPTIRMVIDCGGLYSMPSSHAANHFGLAAFWYYAIKTIGGKKWWGLYWWAGAVCYAQIYVGKHYPFDVLAGACTGLLAGYGMSRIFIYLWEKRSHRSLDLVRWFKKVPGNTN